jgi:LCP family protein required for cell wall assembly
VGLALVVFEGVFLAALTNRIERFDVVLTGSGDGGRTYLLVGGDDRQFVRTADEELVFGDPDEITGERADIVLLAHLPDDGDPVLLSVSRDLLVNAPNGAQTRLALTLLDGPQVLVDALCTSLGVGVDHVLLLDLDGFRRIVDRVGGVEVEVDRPLRDRDLGLLIEDPGTVHLDGDDTLSLVRTRSAEVLVGGEWVAESGGAALREARASAVAAQLGAAAAPSWNHPIRTHRNAWTAAGELRTDQDTGLGDVLGLADRLGDDVDLVELPVRTAGDEVPVAQTTADTAATIELLGGPAPECTRPEPERP